MASGDEGGGPLTHVVKSGHFLHEVVEQGEIESSENVEVMCEVKGRNGQTAILWVIDEGARVKEGEQIVRLDSSAFEQELVQQEIICNTSLALKIQADNNHEAAKIALQEYLHGTYINEKQKIESEALLAKENQRKAQQYVKYSESLAARGYLSALQLEADRFAVDKADTEVKTAETKLEVLEQYTKKKFINQFESDIAIAAAKLRSEESSYELELEKLKVAKHQVEKCDIRSPTDGQVVYANKVSSRGSAEFMVEAGAMVRERQAIVRFPDPTNMQVKAKVNESQVTSIRQGLKATIRIVSYDDEEFPGTVIHVNEYPEATSFFSSQIKEYATFVKIDNPPGKLRPGLTAEVAIRVLELPHALQIPVQAILEHDSVTYCIQYDKGRWSLKEIGLGTSNDKFVVVKSGLSEGDAVVLNPRKYVDKVKLPEIKEEAPQSTGGAGSASEGVPSKGVPSEGVPPKGVGGFAGGGQRGAGGPGRRGGGAPGGGARGGGAPGARGGGGGPGGGGPGGGGAPSPAAIAARILGRLDADKDGILSKSELAADSSGRVAAADKDGDGSVTRAELTAAMSQRGGGGGARGPGGGRQSPPGGGQ